MTSAVCHTGTFFLNWNGIKWICFKKILGNPLFSLRIIPFHFTPGGAPSRSFFFCSNQVWLQVRRARKFSETNRKLAAAVRCDSKIRSRIPKWPSQILRDSKSNVCYSALRENQVIIILKFLSICNYKMDFHQQFKDVKAEDPFSPQMVSLSVTREVKTSPF